MSSSRTALPAPFGRTLCAMVTPFTADGALDLDPAGALAARLVAEGCDGLVLNGTTGESPTTSDAEKSALIRAVRAAVGDGVPLIAGVGSADTRHTLELAGAARAAGADGLLVVTPYYSRPPQSAVAAHFRAVADGAGLPVLLYDIPGRTGTRIEPETLLRLAEHPRVVGVKDCSYDLGAASKVMAEAGLAYYSGCDELNLPLYAIGAAGCVSTVANAAPAAVRAVRDAFDRGDGPGALHRHRLLGPLTELMMENGLPGSVTAKALLGAGPVRAPLQDATAAETAVLRAAYDTLLGAGAGMRPGSPLAAGAPADPGAGPGAATETAPAAA
ncbi:4-hydroxy-tetrahydrodipicolinate synthase [Streptomyces sp. NPDC003691]